MYLQSKKLAHTIKLRCCSFNKPQLFTCSNQAILTSVVANTLNLPFQVWTEITLTNGVLFFLPYCLVFRLLMTQYGMWGLNATNIFDLLASYWKYEPSAQEARKNGWEGFSLRLSITCKQSSHTSCQMSAVLDGSLRKIWSQLWNTQVMGSMMCLSHSKNAGKKPRKTFSIREAAEWGGGVLSSQHLTPFKLRKIYEIIFTQNVLSL